MNADFAANGNKIPVYVRDGALVPMSALSDKACRRLIVRHYGNKAGQTDLYDDDGETFDYKKGKFTVLQLRADILPDGKKEGKIGGDVEKLFNYDSIEFEFMTK